MNMWQEQYCRNGVFGNSPREKELAVNAMLLRKEHLFMSRDHKAYQKQASRTERQFKLRERPYPWQDEPCDVALYCAGFDTLFGPCVFAAVFSPIEHSDDLVNQHNLTDYVS